MHTWATAYPFRRAGFYVRTLREQAVNRCHRRTRAAHRSGASGNDVRHPTRCSRSGPTPAVRSLRYTTWPPTGFANANSGVSDGVAHPIRMSAPRPPGAHRSVLGFKSRDKHLDALHGRRRAVSDRVSFGGRHSTSGAADRSHRAGVCGRQRPITPQRQ
jgi:hypothetical protein